MGRHLSVTFHFHVEQLCPLNAEHNSEVPPPLEVRTLLHFCFKTIHTEIKLSRKEAKCFVRPLALIFWNFVLLNQHYFQAKESNGAIALRNYNLFKIEESKSKTKVGCIEKHCIIMFISNLRWSKSPGKYMEALQKSPRQHIHVMISSIWPDQL